jgi:hypothetical protein
VQELAVSFSDYHENGFDSAVFVSGDDSNSIWMHETGWWEARTRFWYRKFYAETRTGQLMMLRPDVGFVSLPKHRREQLMCELRNEGAQGKS